MHHFTIQVASKCKHVVKSYIVLKPNLNRKWIHFNLIFYHFWYFHLFNVLWEFLHLSGFGEDQTGVVTQFFQGSNADQMSGSITPEAGAKHLPLQHLAVQSQL